MSKRNETLNRIYQASPLRILPATGRKAFRRAIEQAYDAGKAHGYRDQLDRREQP